MKLLQRLSLLVAAVLLSAVGSFAQISGQQNVSPNFTAGYTVQPPSGSGNYTYLWSTNSSNWTIISGQGTASISVKAPNQQADYSQTFITVQPYLNGTAVYPSYSLPVITAAVPVVNSPYCLPPNGAVSVSVMNYNPFDPYLTINWFLSGINQTQSLNNNGTLYLSTPYNFSYGDIEVSVSYYNPNLSLSSGSQSSWSIDNCYGGGGGSWKGSAATAVSLDEAVSIFPNPAEKASGSVEVMLPSSASCDLKVVDKLGNLVLQQRRATGKTTLDIQRLPAGTYFLHVSSKAGKTIKQLQVQ